MNAPIKVVIIDDHNIVRRGLITLINLEDDIEVVADSDNGEEGRRLIMEYKPDVTVLDLSMPKGSGIDVMKKLKQHQSTTKIVVLTSISGSDILYSTLALGAKGLLSKDIDADELLTIIRKVQAGGEYIHPSISHQLTNLQSERFTQQALTRRESQVLGLIGKGLTNQAISDNLTISLKTVKTHVSHILSKLELNDRTQLAIYAIKNEVV
ncbi:response regulator transcription factor [Pleionea sp. CnH1-48]|uniref:response regulator n=1 Tax=Pleionea sp. CnH1-48 TaxID=2954494 RepID=UPI002097BBCF|nr:response regulator transcription factor [Pleionea sp. CnH1-48]MCO7224046.1 response regulator transcription factor [Pleionea sp. CnH1-48]